MNSLTLHEAPISKMKRPVNVDENTDFNAYSSVEANTLNQIDNTLKQQVDTVLKYGAIDIPEPVTFNPENDTMVGNTSVAELINAHQPNPIRDKIAAENDESAHKGLRYNQGKLRYDLLPPFAIEQYVKVMTRGAQKYPARNWEKGMSWTSVIASLKRHLAELEKGNDFDEETGLLHAAQVMWNAGTLTEYYKTYPQGDDRPHTYLRYPKIGLDIDEVLCDWVGAWGQKYGYERPKCWHFSYSNKEHFESFSPEELSEFYLNLPAKISPDDIPFEPHCYITSRSVPVEMTEQWIQKNGFPTVPVYSIGFGQSKVEVAKKSGIEVFVDDRFDNFVELNKAGICTFLLDAPHNQRYNVGYKRIKSLKELFDRI